LYGWGLIGIDTTIAYIVKWLGKEKVLARKVQSLVIIAIIVFSAILSGRYIYDTHATWDQDYLLYQKVGRIVAKDSKEHRDIHHPAQLVVMVNDSADYYYATNQHAVLLPGPGLATALVAAHIYSVSYMLVTPDQTKLWRGTLADPKLKLIWASPSGKLYRLAN
jgi:hypothetical protein